MSRTRHDRKAQRREQALERQAARKERGDLGQLIELTKNQHRALKERAKLLARIPKEDLP